MADLSAVHVRVRGRVQGVGFRYFTQQQAVKFELTGWVRNCSNGDVESEAEGTRDAILLWIERLRQGPNLAHVEEIKTQWHSPTLSFTSFNIQG